VLEKSLRAALKSSVSFALQAESSVALIVLSFGMVDS